MKEGLAKTDRNLNTTRLETWATPGIPDVLICDERGAFHFVELKATAGNAVELRPHQVAWLVNHRRASVWVLVKKVPTKNAAQQVFLFHGDRAVDLKMEGLTAVEPAYHAEGHFDWQQIIDLICPR
jgi:Holliday junction resolvase